MNRTQLFKYALFLGIFTIAYNALEGLFSVYFGLSDDALTLFGFGLDSFVETISAIGVTHMIWRIRRHGEERLTNFEINALRITGWSFYGLCIVLVVSGVLKLIYPGKPLDTLPAIIISGLSILMMWALILAKTRIGKKLGSEPIIADARCNLVCVYMSMIVLGAALLNTFVDFPYIEGLGAMGLAYFSWSEGRESFEKARLKSLACTCD